MDYWPVHIMKLNKTKEKKIIRLINSFNYYKISQVEIDRRGNIPKIKGNIKATKFAIKTLMYSELLNFVRRCPEIGKLNGGRFRFYYHYASYTRRLIVAFFYTNNRKIAQYRSVKL